MKNLAISQKRLQILVVLVLCLVTAAVYARSACFPFCTLDDEGYVVNNSNVYAGLTLSSFSWAFSTFHMTNWHPLTWLSLMLDAQLFGVNPMGYHIVNMILHMANSVLLFYLFSRLTGTMWRSAFVAALFALHPLHVESVVWVSERKDVLSTLFWLLSFILYVLYVKHGKRRYYLLSFAACALGLMTKPMLVTMPVLLLLLDCCFLGRLTYMQTPVNRMSHLRNDLKKVLPDKLPFVILSLASSVITLIAQKPAVATLSHQSFQERVFNALWSIVSYLYRLVLPIDLAIFYPLESIPFWKAALAAVLISGITIAVVRTSRSHPYLGFGWFWYLATLIPVIGLVQVGGQAMADRYTYVPYIGLSVMASWGLAGLAGAGLGRRYAIITAAVTIVASCSVITYNQLGYWRDNITLFSHAINVTKNNYKVHEMLGFEYEQAGKLELAVKEYGEALRIEPDWVAVHHVLGDLLNQKLGRTSEARKHYEAMVRLAPQNPSGHYRLASVLRQIGSLDEAASEYYKAVAINPNDVICQNELGIVLLALNRNNDAIRHFSEAVRLDPLSNQAVNNLRYALSRKGKSLE